MLRLLQAGVRSTMQNLAGQVNCSSNRLIQTSTTRSEYVKPFKPDFNPKCFASRAERFRWTMPREEFDRHLLRQILMPRMSRQPMLRVKETTRRAKLSLEARLSTDDGRKTLYRRFLSGDGNLWPYEA